MRRASPLRYPGGKSSLSGLLRDIRRHNGLGSYSIAEPYAGGAGASLILLYTEDTPEIFINDADPAINDLWWSLTTRSKQFVELLDEASVDMDEWHNQKKLYHSKSKIPKIRRGFSAFYLNRCNRSGIVINGGPIGGLNQHGKWKIDARFNKEDLRKRCEKVYEYRHRIFTSGIDGVKFIDEYDSKGIFFFIDPPYYEKGSKLYLNKLDAKYHASLARRLKKGTSGAWVLTYDDCPEIRELYEGWATIRPFALRYSAAKRRHGKEILIVPKWIDLPQTQSSDSILW